MKKILFLGLVVSLCSFASDDVRWDWEGDSVKRGERQRELFAQLNDLKQKQQREQLYLKGDDYTSEKIADLTYELRAIYADYLKEKLKKRLK